MPPERALNDFSGRIEQGNLSDLTLTIYYKYITTIHFLSVEDLLDGLYDHKIVVSGSELEEHIELLRQITADNLIPAAHESQIYAIMYYTFEANGRTILGVVPQADLYDSTMFINGVEFLWIDALFDVVRPFLPEDRFVNWGPGLQRDAD